MFLLRINQTEKKWKNFVKFKYQMNFHPPQLNLLIAWLWILPGFVSGIYLGLNFQQEKWLGGYVSWKRCQQIFSKFDRKIHLQKEHEVHEVLAV